MSDLLSKIKQNQLEARIRKDSVTTTILTTLIGEMELSIKRDQTKEITDSDLYAIIRKFIKNNDESMKVKYNQTLDQENKILKFYLPTQLATSQLKNIIQNIILSGSYSKKDMSKVIGDLRSQYDGQFDNKFAVQLINEFLNTK